jgi:site-specific DNA recombinase
LTRENLERLVCLVNEEMDSLSNEYRGRLETVEQNVADINRRLERLCDILETGKVKYEDLMHRILQDKYRLEKLQETKAELELKLNERRIELAGVETVKNYVKDLRNLLSERPLTERKSFIKSFVRDVKVTGKEVELTYTIPMPSRGVIKDKMPVLSIVQNGGPLWTRTTDPGLIRTVL